MAYLGFENLALVAPTRQRSLVPGSQAVVGHWHPKIRAWSIDRIPEKSNLGIYCNLEYRNLVEIKY